MAAESTGSRGQRFESGIVEANEATDNSAATELWLAIARLVNGGRARAVVEGEGRREWSACHGDDDVEFTPVNPTSRGDRDSTAIGNAALDQ